jgi:hypothetical protein
MWNCAATSIGDMAGKSLDFVSKQNQNWSFSANCEADSFRANLRYG